LRTLCFDAVVKLSLSIEKESIDGLLLLKKAKIPVSIRFYEKCPKSEHGHYFACIYSVRPISLKWMDKFKIQKSRSPQILGEGKILNPFSTKTSMQSIKKKLSFLQLLLGDEKQAFFALAMENGIKGLSEREATDFFQFSKSSLLAISRELEEEGKVKVLSFSPLFILPYSCFDFLCKEILTFLEKFHERNPAEIGAALERIKKRFSLHQRVLSLAMKYLSSTGQIKRFENLVALSSFKVSLSSEEENLLEELDKMVFKGEFCSVSLEDLKKRFRLSSKKLNSLLSHLIERRKIVQREGTFFLHSHWIDETVWKIQNSGKKELSVSDFKQMTGLTRKYAIPLLELLDQMGVTRRKGASREIL